MEPEELSSRPHARGAESPPCVEAGDPLAVALQELYRALHSTSIYPVGHPAIRLTVERASSQLAAALELRGTAMIGIARTHLLIDRVPVEDGPTTLTNLALFFHSLDVAILELRSGLTSVELERFLLRVRDARQASRSGAALALALAEDKLENIRIFPLDYFGLSFVTHADHGRAEGRASDVWDGLVVNLSDLASASPAADPESLAKDANEQFVTEHGVGSGLLRQQIHAIRQRMPGMDDWQREALRARMSRFVGALNQHLRQDLLRVDPRDADLSLEMMTELSDTLPDGTLLDILRDLNRSGHRAHDQFLNFMNKMARIPSDKSDTLVDLDTVVQRWRITGAIEENPQTFRSALKEVLLRRRQIECNPEPYQEVLDDLTHRELAPAIRLAMSRYRDPCDAVDVQCHAVELAILLLGNGEGKEHAAGILAHVGASTDLLLDTGRFQPVRDAAVVARAICSRDEESDETRRAAAGYLRDFTTVSRIDRILDRAAQSSTVHAAVEPLLALGGTAALQRIIDRLDSKPDRAIAGVLQNVAVTLGRTPMAQVIDARRDEGWVRLRPVLPVVRLLPPADAIGLLESLAGHPESRVRREVLLALCETDQFPGSPERHLRRALGDPEPRIVNLALERLDATGSAESLTILRTFLIGAIARPAAVAAHVPHICRAVLAWGDAGRECLCTCLDTLRKTVRPAKIRVGSAIRSELAAHRDDPRVAKALAAWRRSPAGWIAPLLSVAEAGASQERR